MARSTTALFGMDKIRCVAVDVEAHVASVEPDDGVRFCGCIVHEHFYLLDGVGGGRSLLGVNFVECDKYGGVEGARDVEEGAGDAFYARDAAFIKFRCGRCVGRVLHFGPIRRCEPFLGRVLRARGYGVLEALEGFVDGVGNGDVDVIARVIPFYGKPSVLSAR